MLSATLTSIAIYPVKGLAGLSLESTPIRSGAPLDGDRRWALRLPQSKLPIDQPQWASKRNFAQAVNSPALAALSVAASSDGSVVEVEGARFELPDDGAAFAAAVGKVAAQSDLQLFGPADWLTDQDRPRISLINRASVSALAEATGVDIAPARFRGNLIVDGWAAWAEEDFLGRQLTIGTAIFQVVEGIWRCEAPAVSPQTGVHDLKMVETLKRLYGHCNCGLFLEVVTPGSITLGDDVNCVG